jgi:hypothetical protein
MHAPPKPGAIASDLHRGLWRSENRAMPAGVMHLKKLEKQRQSNGSGVVRSTNAYGGNG